MNYTKKNLRDVEDSAPKFGYSETQEAHFAREDLDAERIGFAYHVVKPGKRQAFAHRHDEAEEVYVVLSGSGRRSTTRSSRSVRWTRSGSRRRPPDRSRRRPTGSSSSRSGPITRATGS